MWLDYTAGVFPDTDTMKLFVKDIVEDGLDLTFEHGDEFFRDHPIRPAGEPVRLEGPIRGWIVTMSRPGHSFTTPSWGGPG